ETVPGDTPARSATSRMETGLSDMDGTSRQGGIAAKRFTEKRFTTAAAASQSRSDGPMRPASRQAGDPSTRR
ncbi:MAG: hypothetical protein J0H21_05035, partial [Rhizobiales bacterium]|nr:hypothetical protein [Hyphomicrobiales bacterium]